MHKINKKSPHVLWFFLQNEMQDKYNIIFLVAVFAAAARSWPGLP